MVIIIFGLPGSGKSYFATRLAKSLNALYMSSDQLRSQLLTEKNYTEEEKLYVYDEMVKRIKSEVKPDKFIVVDATFYKRELRRIFIDQISPLDTMEFIEVTAKDVLVKERLHTRRKDSDADISVYEKIKGQWDPMQQPHLHLESNNQNIDEMLQKATHYIDLKL